VLALAIGLMLAVVATRAVEAQTLQVIHNFANGSDGRNPFAGLTADGAGNLYGTAVNGGRGCGTVFQLKQKGSGWTLNPLYSFAGSPDGCDPEARVIFGPNGTLFGTTYAAGPAGDGTVFNLRPFPSACKAALCPWMETVLYGFSGAADGGGPGYGDLLFDPAGNIYGTTYMGGLKNSDCDPFQSQTCGVVYKLTPSNGAWTESVLYSFKGGSDGGNPYSGLILDQAGNFYGTTYIGGLSGFGTVFQLTCGSGGCTNNVLHDFTNGGDGGSPIGGLIFQSGNLYGVGSDGGTGGDGTVFELSPSGSGWTFTVIYNFTSPEGAQCGPRAGLSMDAAGNLYGTTYCDGVSGYGNVFELIALKGGGWMYKDLHDFSGGNDGKNPISSVLLHPNGKLYGTTSVGGTEGFGVVWELTP